MNMMQFRQDIYGKYPEGKNEDSPVDDLRNVILTGNASENFIAFIKGGQVSDQSLQEMDIVDYLNLIIESKEKIQRHTIIDY